MSEKMADPISLRFPATLREKLDHAAKQAQRSLNAEIRMRLEGSFEGGFEGVPSVQMLANEVESIRSELRAEVTTFNSQISALQKRMMALEKTNNRGP